MLTIAAKEHAVLSEISIKVGFNNYFLCDVQCLIKTWCELGICMMYIHLVTKTFQTLNDMCWEDKK